MTLSIDRIIKEMVMMSDEVDVEVKESDVSKKDYLTYAKPYPDDNWPDKIKLNDRVLFPEHSEFYYRRVRASIIITMKDSDNIIGSSKCSICNSSVNIGDRFCHECGARLIDKQVIEKD